ncbi:MAG TPA: TCR/Tet family MFS transporter [Candidatus Acidoferrales bacterium]|nr:TCR/Tet family MFS transporter [Candidatus Acidoferrales bacterium]
MPVQHERRALAIVLATLLIDMIGFGVVMPVMPSLIVQLTHAPIGEAARLGGWLMFGFAVMQFLCGPVMGGLGDRFGRRPVILASLSAFALDYLVMGFAPTIGWLFASRAVAGIAGASFVPASAYIADITPPERRAQNFGLIGAAFGTGFVLGPALGGLLGSFGVRAPFIAAAALAMINATLGFFLLPESLPAGRRRPFALARANPFGTFRSLARRRGALTLLAAWFLWMLAHQSYPAVWAFYTRLRFGWGPGAIGASLAYVGLLMALGQAFVTRRLVPRIGERRAILLGLTLGSLGFAGNAFASRGWMVYAVCTVAALQGLVFPSMNSALSRTVAPDEQGELQGGIASLQSVAAILGPPVLTQAFAYFTRPGAPLQFPGAAYLLAALLSLAAIATVALFARRAFVVKVPAA